MVTDFLEQLRESIFLYIKIQIHERGGDQVNRRLLRGTVIALVMVCCVAGGYLAGMKWGSPESETAPFQSESKANEYDTHMFAIVNLDEGINNDGETISYSQALLGTLDVQYEVTNLEAARQGIQDGRYSAYLIIPGTFSAATC